MSTETKETEIQWECDECKLQFRPPLIGCITLEDVAARLRREYAGWFVYVGGNHVALHRSAAADSPRLLLIKAKGQP